MRARGFNLRDQYADVLKGVSVAEEAIDIMPTEPTQLEPQKPATQEEKGASIREKMQAKHEAPSAATPARKGQVPIENGGGYDSRIKAATTIPHVTAIIKDLVKDISLTKTMRETFVDRANRRVVELEAPPLL